MANSVTASDYKAGQRAFYHESGEVDEVEVLEVNGDETFERYKLRVIRNIKESGIAYPSKVGDEFCCEKRRDISCCGLWHLLNH